MSASTADLVQEKLAEEAKAPRLVDFCPRCRPLAKQILDKIHSDLLRLRQLTEPLPKSRTVTIPAGELPR